MSTTQIIVVLLAVIAAVAVVALRLKVPVAIPLVITGVVLALIPGLPQVEMAPEFVLLMVLPLPLELASAELPGGLPAELHALTTATPSASTAAVTILRFIGSPLIGS